jgi:D-serine deaminase-like pyridoxal phosphate-dependent protein
MKPEFDTPAVVVDLDMVETNIHRMMELMARFPHISVHPHLKTPKSPEFAKMLLDRGARGICVAKVSEAEVFSAAGITDILITTEIAGKTKIARLLKLRSACPGLKVVVDNLAVATQLNDACAENPSNQLQAVLERRLSALKPKA